MEERNEARQIVCVTPVKNEGWFLDRFLRATELWADRIIVADQGSTDDTREIARRFSKVTLVDNPRTEYDEGARQRLLISAAREVPGPKVVVALDADEVLTPNWTSSPEWQGAFAAPPGTVLAFDWVNVLPGWEQAYLPSEPVPFGYVDDGAEHSGDRIHATRVPVPAGADVRHMGEVKVIHLQYADWQRMKSKQRWYQCWEAINGGAKRPVQLYRQYHRMDAFPPEEIVDFPRAWVDAYARLGVDIAPEPTDDVYWWDEEVYRWIADHGPERFRRLAIWEVDWDRVADTVGANGDRPAVADPRSPLDRAVHRWLARTQARASAASTRCVQRMLVPLGW
jgi:glycosyltransferase involved in cell wall biosynthesis